MNDLFRNMLVSGGGSSSGTSSEHAHNPFVGTTIQLKEHQVKLEDLIAEGGFGYVFRARDTRTSKLFALKRLVASDSESLAEIENEISMLNRVQPHKHIMAFHYFELVKPNVYLLLCEYCGSGSLSDLQLPIQNNQLLFKICYQIALALEKLHHLNIIHRDIKIENVLFDNSGYIKLCDFGSATDKSFVPDLGWTPIQRSLLEDEMSRHTTPMYRPPEILDTYLHLPINTAMDIWAYGCLLFCLRFGSHPFEDSAKLRIINCNYTIPKSVANPDADVIVQMIKSCLKINPDERTNATELIGKFEENFVDLNSPCIAPKSLPNASAVAAPANLANSGRIAQSASGSESAAAPVPGMAQSYFSGFTKILKDTSSKVMQTVQK